MTEKDVIEAEQKVQQIKRELEEAERMVSMGYGFDAAALNARVRLKHARLELKKIKQQAQPTLLEASERRELS